MHLPKMLLNTWMCVQKSKNKYCLGHVSLEISLNFGIAMDTPLRFLLFPVQEINIEILFISHTPLWNWTMCI